MDILNNEPTGQPQCSICLNEITNKCYTNACVHLFCFDCLQRWSNTCLQQCSRSEPTCPLCKQTFRYIYHSFDDLGNFETYTVPILPSLIPVNEQEFRRMLYFNSFSSMDHRIHTRMSTLRRGSVFDLDEVGNNYRQLYHLPPQNYTFRHPTLSIIGQRIRIQVYVNNMWAVPSPDTDGRFRYGTTDFLRNNPTQIHRLRTFVLRDVVAIRESVRLESQPLPFPGRSDFRATNLILSSLAVYGIRQLHFVNELSRFLNVHAVHFCHELYNFAHSIFEIRDYDNNVQYTHQRHHSELTASFYRELSPPNHIALDSNNEELQRPNIIEDSSSTNNSDVEVLSDSFRSTNRLNSASINQPSTSTGIRDSLDRPDTNNSFQSVNGDLSQVSYSSQVNRGRPNSDESNDEESIIATQSSHPANLKSRDVNNKKKKKHQ